MKIEYDPKADALYITLRRGKIGDTLEGGPGVNIDVDTKGKPLGIEILYAARRLGRNALLNLGIDLSGLQWTPVQDELLSTKQASRLLRVSRQYVSRLAREGKVSARRAGRDWLIHRSGLERWKQGETPPIGRRS